MVYIRANRPKSKMPVPTKSEKSSNCNNTYNPEYRPRTTELHQMVSLDSWVMAHTYQLIRAVRIVVARTYDAANGRCSERDNKVR